MSEVSIINKELTFNNEYWNVIDKAQLKEFEKKLSEPQKKQLEDFLKKLDSQHRIEFMKELVSKWDKIENILDEIDKGNNKDKFSDLIILQKLVFKDDKDILKKIDIISKEWKELKKEIVYLDAYIKLFKEMFLWSNKVENKDQNKKIDILAQNSKTLEMLKNRYWKLEIQLKTLETKIVKEKRYEWVEKTYEEIIKNEEIQKIIEKKKFNDISAGEFYAMLKTNPNEVRKLLLSTEKWDQFNGTFNEKDKFTVNFWRNKWLDKIIWAWDILDIKNIEQVKINWVLWTRKSSPRPWYYTKTGGYLAIHDWYKIEVVKKSVLTKDTSFNEAIEKRFVEIRWTEVKSNFGTLISKNIKENSNLKEIENPYKSKVDKKLIEEIIWKDEYKYLWVKINDKWNIEVWKDFNILHLWEVLNWYQDIKWKVTKYLSENKKLINSKNIEFDILKLNLWNNNIFIENAFKSIIWNNDIDIKVKNWKVKIDTNNTKLTIWNLFSTWYEYKWSRHTHEKYINEVKVAASSYWIPQWAIINLIYHENWSWNPSVKAPWSSAYWLWQMINSTWSRFWVWNRNNPADQLMATAKYMSHIKNTKNCSWEEVLAYYNTWLWIKSPSVNIQKYFRLNTPIRNKLPVWEDKNNETYFISAIAYYNDISYEDAKKKIAK